MKIYLARAIWTNPKNPQNKVFREFVTGGETEDEAKEKVTHLLDSSVWEDNFELKLMELTLPFELF